MTVDIIVHGPNCPDWPSPQTTEEWLAARLVPDEVAPGDWTIGNDASRVSRCPFCKQAVIVYHDDGTIDFGVDQPDLIRQNSVSIEIVQPIALHPER